MTAEDTRIRELPIDGDTVRIVQITDTHLKGYPGGTLLGLDTDDSLQAIIDLVKTEYPNPDLILGTGDLADSGAAGAYERLLDYFGAISDEHYWLPGNHDLRDVMIDVGGARRLPDVIRVGAWQIIMLDSQIPGEVGGHLGEQELGKLDEYLAAGEAAGLYSLVCLHHQPVPIGCSWLDEQMVQDADAFFAVLDRYKQVRGVLWGHVHQALDTMRNDLRLLCTPSTCVQFLPQQEDFAVDTLSPGYRWMELGSDGVIRTGVSRAESREFFVDRDASGYL